MGNKTIMTGAEARLGFPVLFDPASVNSAGKKKYTTAVLIPKSDTQTIKAIEAAIEAAAVEGTVTKWDGKRPASLNNPLHDGDAKSEKYPEYAGMYYLNTSTIRTPRIVDVYGAPVTNPDRVYGGVYARVKINFFAYSVNGNRGIAAGLDAVQIVRDGPRFGATAKVNDFPIIESHKADEDTGNGEEDFSFLN